MDQELVLESEDMKSKLKTCTSSLWDEAHLAVLLIKKVRPQWPPTQLFNIFYENKTSMSFSTV